MTSDAPLGAKQLATLSKKRAELHRRKFGRLTVIGVSLRGKRQSYRCLCRCECGNKIETTEGNVRSGHTKSCGCLRLELLSRPRKHGFAKRNPDALKHKIYYTWASMVARCSNSKGRFWHRYGGRGIKVCDRWKNSFEAFHLDMGNPPSMKHMIDRIDNDGDYERGNCRWVTAKDQQRNRSNNRLIRYQGRIQCAEAWFKELGLKRSTFDKRRKAGVTDISELLRPPSNSPLKGSTKIRRRINLNAD